MDERHFAALIYWGAGALVLLALGLYFRAKERREARRQTPPKTT